MRPDSKLYRIIGENMCDDMITSGYDKNVEPINLHTLDKGIADQVDHPNHYGGDTVYETIKVIEAWDLNFNLGNTVKYISRAGKKDNKLQDLQKAKFYLDREINKIRKDR